MLQPENSYVMPQILPNVLEFLCHKLRETFVILWAIFSVQAVGSWAKCRYQLNPRSSEQSSALKSHSLSGSDCLSALTVQFPFHGIWAICPLVMDVELGPLLISEENPWVILAYGSVLWNTQEKSRKSLLSLEKPNQRESGKCQRQLLILPIAFRGLQGQSPKQGLSRESWGKSGTSTDNVHSFPKP